MVGSAGEVAARPGSAAAAPSSASPCLVRIQPSVSADCGPGAEQIGFLGHRPRPLVVAGLVDPGQVVQRHRIVRLHGEHRLQVLLGLRHAPVLQVERGQRPDGIEVARARGPASPAAAAAPRPAGRRCSAPPRPPPPACRRGSPPAPPGRRRRHRRSAAPTCTARPSAAAPPAGSPRPWPARSAVARAASRPPVRKSIATRACSSAGLPGSASSPLRSNALASSTFLARTSRSASRRARLGVRRVDRQHLAVGVLRLALQAERVPAAGPAPPARRAARPAPSALSSSRA